MDDGNPKSEIQNPKSDGAVGCYVAGVALGDELAVKRMRAEAMWGLTRAYGFGGDLRSAERAAAEGVEIGRWAGDAWIVALIELTLGASYVLAGCPREAVDVLAGVLAAFRECGDTLGRAATRLWLSLAYSDLGQVELRDAAVEDALFLCEAHGYGFLFTTSTLLGPPDVRRLVPLLLHARSQGPNVGYVNGLLGKLNLADVQVHPGYRLCVFTLGGFRVVRGDVEVEPREWQRERARQLFQLLLTDRGHWRQREELVDRLWPSLSPEAAGRDFKVALNALNKAIEPHRAPDAPFAFLAREGTSYRIRPEADLWLDSEEFERGCHAGLRAAGGGDGEGAIPQLSQALGLYRGHYLPDALYEDWARGERERLLSLYLKAADTLARLLVESGRFGQALDVCARMLRFDPCWERAYRWMMLAHTRQGDRAIALRAYERCAQVMQTELGMEPGQETTELYKQILGSNVKRET